MGASTNTEIIDFTAGMNTVQAKHLIAPNEARALVNVNIQNGSLLSVPTLLHLGRAAQPYFMEFIGRVYYYRHFRTNALMNNNWYWADGVSTGKVLWDGRRLPLGILTPTTPATITDALNTPDGTHTGDFKYTYTFYSTDTGVESAPAPLPPYLTVDKSDIIVDGLQDLPPEANSYRIYRIGGYLPLFTMVTQLDVVVATSAVGTVTLGGTTAIGGQTVTLDISNDLGTVVDTAVYTTVAGDTPELIALALALIVTSDGYYRTEVTSNVITLTSVGVGTVQNLYTFATVSTDANITVSSSNPTGAVDQVNPFPYTDNLDDTEIDGRLLNTLHCGKPQDGMQDFVELNGRLFGSLGSKLYFSALGNPDAWYINDFFTMPDTITGVAKAPAGLLVFGTSYTYLLVGSSPHNFRLKVISNILGCISRKSIAYIKDGVIWLSETGLCLSNGYQITDLTSDKIDSVVGIEPTSACVLNEVYYLSFRPSLYPTEYLFPELTLYPGAAIGTSDVENGVIYVDFKRGSGYSYGLFDFQDISSIGVVDGELHIVTVINNVIFLSCTDPLECDDYLQCTAYDMNMANKYRGADLAPLSYVSPTLINGSLSTLKQYDKIRINAWGDFNVKVMFSDGSIAIEEDISIDKITSYVDGHEIVTDAVTLIGIPNQENSSFSIGFIIQGTGSIKSIQYNWKPRELP